LLCVNTIGLQTDVEGQIDDEDALLKCFTPLLNSMRLFGLYFTRTTRHSPDAARSSTFTTVKTKTRLLSRAYFTYVVVILVVNWLNVVRMCTVFEKTDKFGFVLLIKMALMSGSVLCAVLHTACFVASHSGNLNRVFRRARLSRFDHIRYRRLAVIHTTICWVRIVTEEMVQLVPLMLDEKHWDMSMAPFGIHVAVSDQHVTLVRLLSSLFFLPAYAALTFPYSVNYIDH